MDTAYRARVESRFWNHVDMSGGPDSCWTWNPGSLAGRSTYGIFTTDIMAGRKKAEGAHRVAYFLAYGQIPPDKPFICHTCDFARCVNPAHLFAGTPLDNTRDMIAKGRGRFSERSLEHRPRGETHSAAKLTREQVATIRAAVAAGETQREQCRRYGISPTQMSRIIHGESWGQPGEHTKAARAELAAVAAANPSPEELDALRAARESAVWSRVDRRGPGECWPWTGYVAKNTGVPMMTMSLLHGKPRAEVAARVVYLLEHGSPVPAGHFIRMSCGDRMCCNPAHFDLRPNRERTLPMLRARGLA